MTFLIMLIIAYLLGSLSSAVILSKFTGASDPRSQGSGNAGATNVLRTQGKQAAVIVLLCDMAKGWLAVVLAAMVGFSGFNLGMIGLGAVAGHIFPLYFEFKGGKGVATAFGVTLAFSFVLALLGALVFAAIVYLKRFASLASLSSLAIVTILSLFLGYASYFFPLLFITLLVAWKHLENIKRLFQGTENKVYFK